MKDFNFSLLRGVTLKSVTPSDEAVHFETTDGRTFQMYHDQSCCESVNVESIKGDLADLLDTPLTETTEVISNENPPDMPVPEYQDSFTWTTFTLATERGKVVIRWYGSSNGYYSESVTFVETTEDQR